MLYYKISVLDGSFAAGLDSSGSHGRQLYKPCIKLEASSNLLSETFSHWTYIAAFRQPP